MFDGCLLSTRFRVKDREKFLADPEVEAVKNHAEKNQGFFDEEDGYFLFGWSGLLLNIEIPLDDNEEEYITEVIRKHILPGDVCQIGISGNEKLWYNGGPLFWITSKGTVSFNGSTETDVKLTEKDLHAQAETLLADIGKTLKQMQD
jgi:hypothetical protein